MSKIQPLIKNRQAEKKNARHFTRRAFLFLRAICKIGLFFRAFRFCAVHQFFNRVGIFRHFVGEIEIAFFGD